MNIWFLTASIASLFVLGLHVFGGGKTTARPLLDSVDMRPIPKYTNYYCWHLVTIVIASMSIMFLLAAMRSDTYMLAWVGTIYAVLFTFWNIALNIGARKHFKAWYDLPQWALFLPVAILGALGLTHG